MLHSIPGLKGGRAQLGQLILLSDTITDGAFLAHHFIGQALKDGHHTLLVSLSQSFLHYSSVSSKLGINLHKKKEDGQFVFVDGLTSLLSKAFPPISTIASPSPANTPTTITTSSKEGRRKEDRVCISVGSDFSVTGIVDALQELVLKARQEVEGPVCLIIDGLSLLLNVGVALGDVVVLVQMCMQMLTLSKGPCQGEGYLVVMVHCEDGGEEEPESILHKHLLHLCHLHLQARGLTTGYSRDIHGEVSVCWRDPASTGKQLPTKQTAQYKLGDKSVQIFSKGLSKAVL